jgi:hypothetical protein
LYDDENNTELGSIRPISAPSQSTPLNEYDDNLLDVEDYNQSVYSALPPIRFRTVPPFFGD